MLKLALCGILEQTQISSHTAARTEPNAPLYRKQAHAQLHKHVVEGSKNVALWTERKQAVGKRKCYVAVAYL
jgi:hypothetical protein